MPLEIKDAYKVDDTSFPYIFEQNATVPLKTSSSGIIRCNVYRPKSENEKYPVSDPCEQVMIKCIRLDCN